MGVQVEQARGLFPLGKRSSSYRLKKRLPLEDEDNGEKAKAKDGRRRDEALRRGVCFPALGWTIPSECSMLPSPCSSFLPRLQLCCVEEGAASLF